MESPSAITFTIEPSDASSVSQVSSRHPDDVTSLTSFNPFSEEDENDHSSYALMTSILSRVKSTFTTPLSSAPLSSNTGAGSAGLPNSAPVERFRRPSASVVQNQSSNESSRSSSERPPSMTVVPSHVAPPLVSLTPVVSEGLSFNADLDLSLSRGASFNTSVSDNIDGGLYGTTIPGFSIPEDSRSIKTSVSVKRSASVSKVIRRIRGEGTSVAPCSMQKFHII
jgi:1-phosphatidylinositol-3-phosphate 5-kinase